MSNSKKINEIEIRPLASEYFADVIELGNAVHGEGYLTLEFITDILKKSILNNINASFVAYDGDSLVGFRLTYAAGQWPIDKWCTPDKWGHPLDKVCYFKSNTIDEQYRGRGIGHKLLTTSIDKVKQQGATAGLAHIWLQSPGNSAYRYMTRAGGIEIKTHPDRWHDSSLKDGYTCIVCPDECHCSAVEMILDFNKMS